MVMKAQAAHAYAVMPPQPMAIAAWTLDCILVCIAATHAGHQARTPHNATLCSCSPTLSTHSSISCENEKRFTPLGRVPRVQS